jgi:hypothetical protein
MARSLGQLNHPTLRRQSALGRLAACLVVLSLLGLSLGCAAAREATSTAAANFDGNIRPKGSGTYIGADEIGSTSFPYVLDQSTVFPYPTYSMPAKGITITDPTFHTSFRRVTQKSVDGYPSPAMTPEYSKADPSNANGTRLILRGLDAQWYLYDSQTLALLNGGPIPNLPQDEIEPRWDAQDPNIFYYRQSDDMLLRAFNISTNTSSVVHDFSGVIAGGVAILNDSEGDSSADSRYWAFEVRGDPPDTDHILGVITYDRLNDRVIGKKFIPAGGLMPNWVGIDASGTHVIFPPEDGVHPMVAYHLDFSHPVSLTVSAGHSDLALDKQGRDVIVYQDNATDTISMADLETGSITTLLHIPFDVNPDIGVHISGNSVKKPGWALVTTGGGSYVSWMDRQFWMLELTPNPCVWRLGWTRLKQCSSPSDYNYFAEGWATINKAGTKLWWQSNKDIAACSSDDEDVYQMSLPAFPDEQAANARLFLPILLRY